MWTWVNWWPQVHALFILATWSAEGIHDIRSRAPDSLESQLWNVYNDIGRHHGKYVGLSTIWAYKNRSVHCNSILMNKIWWPHSLIPYILNPRHDTFLVKSGLPFDLSIRLTHHLLCLRHEHYFTPSLIKVFCEWGCQSIKSLSIWYSSISLFCTG